MKTKLTFEEIQNVIQLCIDEWNVNTGGYFSWVDDSLYTTLRKVVPDIIDEEVSHITYVVHIGWVQDWNKSDRCDKMDVFLTNWNTVENIERAFKLFYDERHKSIVLGTADKYFEQGLEVSQFDFDEEWIDELNAKGVNVEKVCEDVACFYRLTKEHIVEVDGN